MFERLNEKKKKKEKPGKMVKTPGARYIVKDMKEIAKPSQVRKIMAKSNDMLGYRSSPLATALPPLLLK
jgi:hypothetical protein